MTLRAVSSVLSAQALVVGRISDALTGGDPRRAATVALGHRRAGAGEFRPFPGTLRMLSGSYYAWVLAPDAFTPPPGPNAVLEFRLTVEALGYQRAEHVFTLTAQDVAVVHEVTTVAGHQVRVRTFPGLPVVLDVALQPLPVALAGFVVDDGDDPGAPVEGATVRVTAPEPRPETTTDARGHFRIDDLPVALAVTVRVTLEGRALVREVALDPYQPVNQETFSLPA